MNCAPQHYYLLNNYNPGYNGDGTVLDRTKSPFTISPSPVRTIGDTLLERHIPWKYYGEGWNTFVSNPEERLLQHLQDALTLTQSVSTDRFRSTECIDVVPRSSRPRRHSPNILASSTASKVSLRPNRGAVRIRIFMGGP
jgi:hypothetical protein